MKTRENDASTHTHPPPSVTKSSSALAVAMTPTQPEIVYRGKWKKQKRRGEEIEIEKYKRWNTEYKRWKARSSFLLPVCFRSAVTERLIPVLVWLCACVHGFWPCKERERVTSVTYAFSSFDFSQRSRFHGTNQNDRAFWERDYSLLFSSLFIYIVLQMSPAWVFFSSAMSGCLTNLL